MERIAILAAYNLETSIGKIVERTQKQVDLVIVVTDGSKDQTNLKAKLAGAKCPSHTSIRGKGFAQRKGILFSKKFNPKYIILMDADGQHIPEQIPILLAPIKKNDYDMVVGSRFMGELRTSFINRLGNFILKFISFLITKKWFTDTESGFRAFKAEKLYNLNLKSTYYEIEGEYLLQSLLRGYRVKEVPITVPRAIKGITIVDGLRMGLYKIKLIKKFWKIR